MTGKKAGLDDATVQIVKNVLAMPPRHHDEMKVGRQAKQRSSKGRAASAKPRAASKTDRDY